MIAGRLTGRVGVHDFIWKVVVNIFMSKWIQSCFLSLLTSQSCVFLQCIHDSSLDYDGRQMPCHMEGGRIKI